MGGSVGEGCTSESMELSVFVASRLRCTGVDSQSEVRPIALILIIGRITIEAFIIGRDVVKVLVIGRVVEAV